MDAGGEFLGEQRIDGAMSLDPAFSGKGGRDDAHAKMGFPSLRRAALMHDMTGMLVQTRR